MAQCIISCHDAIVPRIFNAKPTSQPFKGFHTANGKNFHLIHQRFRSPKNSIIKFHINGRICSKVSRYSSGPFKICRNRISQLFFSSCGGYGGNGGENGKNNMFGSDDGDDDYYNLLWNPSLTGLLILWQVFAKDESKTHLRRALVWLCFVLHWQSFSALAKTAVADNPSKEEIPVTVDGDNVADVVWDVKGGKWRKILVDYVKDEFVFEGEVNGIGCASQNLEENGVDKADLGVGKDKKGLGYVSLSSVGWCKDFILGLMLPDGYPRSVTSDYLEYSLWRLLQGIASQINGVLTTQALLYAVGLGKGAIPTAAAVNWVLKDGIGYLSKILLSKYGRHFDVHPKGWRLFADVLENAAGAMELLTPAFPQFFVYIGAVAGAGRSAAGLIQAATRSCFYAGFASQRNFAEVIAKGEAQGMVSKSLGILFGIVLSNYTGSSGPLLIASFVIVTGFHMFCNLKSYQAVQIRTLNPYRASLVFSEYLSSGSIPSVKGINDEEPIFTRVPLFNIQLKSFLVSSQVLRPETKKAAEDIDAKLQLGSKFSDVIHSKGEADALFDLYQDEKYLLAESAGKFLVLLKSAASPQDMMRAMFQVCHLYWLEKHVGIKSRNITYDCKPGGKLMLSLEYMQSEFDTVQQKARKIGWLPDGLVARPLPFRLQLK